MVNVHKELITDLHNHIIHYLLLLYLIIISID